jgi:hypothetical protein
MKCTRLSLKQLVETGILVPYLLGAEGEGEGAGAAGAGGASDENKDGSKTGDGGAEAKKDESKDGDPQKKIAALTEEKDRHVAARQAAERERDELKAKVDEAERKEKSDLENAQTDLAKRDETIAKKDEVIRRLTIKTTFLADDTVVWHDQETALSLVDLSEVKFDDKTGEVSNPDALVAAIKRLATDKPYLVKSADEKDSKDDKKPAPRSGKPPAKGSDQDRATREAELKKKYPALHSH